MIGRQALSEFLQYAMTAPANSVFNQGVAWRPDKGWRVILAVAREDLGTMPTLEMSPSDAEKMADVAEKTNSKIDKITGTSPEMLLEATKFVKTLANDLRTDAKQAKYNNQRGYTPWNLPEEGHA